MKDPFAEVGEPIDGSWRLAARRCILPSAFAALILFSCGQPADLERARSFIDSARVMEKADSARRAMVNDSLKDGPHVYRSQSGLLLMEGQMLNGQREGLWTSYHASGKVKSRSEYQHGLNHGLTAVFHENGNPYYSGDSRNGHPVGEWSFFDLGGGLLRTVKYDSTGAVINDR